MIMTNKPRRMDSRRQFMLKSGRLLSTAFSAAALAPFGLVSAHAQSTSSYKAMVCIFLFGGNDANNMVVPMGASYTPYQTVRQGLAIPQASLLPVTNSAGATYGLHPSLQPIHPLYATGKLAVVNNVGMLVRPTTRAQFTARTVPVPNNLFSHSDQQQQWQNASPLVASTTGWAGRVADRVNLLNQPSNFPPSVSISGNSLQLIGQSTLPTTINSTEFGIAGSDHTPASDARTAALQEMLAFDSGAVLLQTANTVLRDAIRVAQLVEDATRNSPALVSQFPGTGLGQQLAEVAKIIQARTALGMRRQIFFVTQGGFDTHNGQLGSQANLLTQLALGMGAFHNAMGELGVQDSVVQFTESEFSRTFQPNNGAGTDHAWGGHCLALGGGVKGGNTYGRFPVLALGGDDDSGNRGNWIPTISQDQYGAGIAQWFGVPANELTQVFPNLVNFSTPTAGFMMDA